ncbi:alpha/beta fold hydrolase [Algirhabdus cladophorae]|uniref:alpha/beta fold hydrolase n=1 Tax=Algirhabdus cladophorae TaxID=3377108 RepID=UPI003B846D97
MAKFRTSDGVTLYYSDTGTGSSPPILCLSGLTRNSRDFDYVTPHLAEQRLIKLDYRGRGQSDWTDFETYTIPREALDCFELLDHLGLDKAAILGTSRGGLIAMVLAATAKDRLSGVALNDIGPELMSEGLDSIGIYLGRNPSQKTYAEAVEMRASLLPGFQNVPTSRWQNEVEMHYRETPDGLQINYDPKLRDAVLSARTKDMPDLWPLFEALIGLPTLCLRGANSNLLSADTLDRMQKRHPHMIATTVPDRGHVPFLDEPTSLAALRTWISHLT